MSAPVTTKELRTLLPDNDDGLCERLSKASRFDAAFTSLYNWMFPDGEVSEELLTGICGACTTTTTTTLTTSTSSTTTTDTTETTTTVETSSTTSTTSTTSTSTTSTTTEEPLVWEEMTAPTNHWRDIAVSNDGQTAIAVSWNNLTSPLTAAGRIYVTFDGGDTWTDLTPADSLTAFFKACAINEDGTRMYAVDRGRNFWSWNGSEFVKTTITIIPSTSPISMGIDCSDDGMIVYIANIYGIYLSTDGGANWVESDPNNIPVLPHNICCSADGTIAYCADSASRWRKTTDTGATWGTAPGGLGSEDLLDVDCSGDGVHVGSINGPTGGWSIKVSHDSATNIGTAAGIPLFGSKIQISDDGTHWLVADSDITSDGPLLLSTDTGVTFVEQDELRKWISCALSEDGCTKMAAVWEGKLYRHVCTP